MDKQWEREILRASSRLNRRQAAQLARCTERTIDRWRESGFITATRVPGGGGAGDRRTFGVRIDRDSLLNFLRGESR
jgi:hypothetical protein